MIKTDDFLYLEDKVFKAIVRTIAPTVIGTENGPILDSFADSLGNLSPISINITDVFYKSKNQWDPVLNKPPTNYIKNVQDTLNKTYMNNFWKLKNKYTKNYLINHRLQETLYQYSLLGDIDINGDYGFFDNYEQLFTEDKHIANREFKIRKGSKTSLEYAYKNVWNARVEGNLQEEYYFDFSDTRYDKILNIGSCINPSDPSFVPDPNYNPFPPYYDNPYPYPPQEPFCDDTNTCNCTEPGLTIGNFIISNTIGNQIELKKKFKYDVSGSLMPIFFHTMVKDLAHPVGFRYDYKRYFELKWEDIFNLSIPVYADTVGVKSLCYNNDCNNPLTEYYVHPDNTLSITKSSLKNIEYYSTYKNNIKYDASKFIFENGQFLLQYYNENLNRILVEYYDNDFTKLSNLIPNADFDNTTSWSMGDRWSIDTSTGEAVLVSSGSTGVISQSLSLESDTNYIFEIDITEINGELELKIGDEFLLSLSTPGKYYTRFYKYASAIEDIILLDKLTNSTARVNYIKMYKDIPTKIYKDSWHSAVVMEGFKYLRPLLTTKDESECLIDTGDIVPFDQNDPYCGDYLNDLVINYHDYPIIGDEIIIGDGMTGDLNYFTIGCYDGSTGIYFPPYDSPDGCCSANDPHNPPGTPPGTCIYGSTIYNDIRLKYIYDNIALEEVNNKKRIDYTKKGFDASWSIVSGNATIIDGVLSQDGTEESIIEKYLDECPKDGHFLNIRYLKNRTDSVETKITIEYVNFDGTVLYSGLCDSSVEMPEWGWLINNSSCDNINKVKIRLILPIDYIIPIKDIEVFGIYS